MKINNIWNDVKFRNPIYHETILHHIKSVLLNQILNIFQISVPELIASFSWMRVQWMEVEGKIKQWWPSLTFLGPLVFHQAVKLYPVTNMWGVWGEEGGVGRGKGWQCSTQGHPDVQPVSAWLLMRLEVWFEGGSTNYTRQERQILPVRSLAPQDTQPRL